MEVGEKDEDTNAAARKRTHSTQYSKQYTEYYKHQCNRGSNFSNLKKRESENISLDCSFPSSEAYWIIKVSDCYWYGIAT